MEAQMKTAARSKRSFRARILENRPVREADYLLTFEPPGGAPEPLPGQFYMVETGSSIEPLLKRPFCYFRKSGQGIQLLYRVRGRGTELLSKVAPGSSLPMLGPLGNSYPMPSRKQRPVVLAGGVAVASVFSHVERLKGRATVILGAKTEGELLMAEELRKISGELHLCTDDGSAGYRGTALDMLAELAPGPETLLYCCGPKPMTAAIAAYAREKGLRGYASLEEYMACGVGACMGCVVGTTRGYRRVCKEGPLFKLEEVIF